MIDVVGPLEAAVAELSELSDDGTLWRPVVEGRCSCGRQIGLVGRIGPQWAWQWLSLVPSRADQFMKGLQPIAAVRDASGERVAAPRVGMLTRVLLIDPVEDSRRMLPAHCVDKCHQRQRFDRFDVLRALREATSPTGSPVTIGPASTT